jgi:hypothetical protein
MDADDVSLPERLAVQVDYLDNHPEVGLVCTNCYFINSEGVVTRGPFLESALNSAQLEWLLYWMNPIVHPSVMFRTRVFQRCGGYPRQYSHYVDDYALWLRMLRVTQMFVLHQPLLHLRKHGQSATVVSKRENAVKLVGLMQSVFADLLGFKPSDQCILLTRKKYLDDSVSAREFEGTVTLLRKVYRSFVARHASDQDGREFAKFDLAKRLLRLVTYHGERNRAKSLVTMVYLIFLAPPVAFSSISLKVVLRLIFSRRLVASAGWITRRISL